MSNTKVYHKIVKVNDGLIYNKQFITFNETINVLDQLTYKWFQENEEPPFVSIRFMKLKPNKPTRSESSNDWRSKLDEPKEIKLDEPILIVEKVQDKNISLKSQKKKYSQERNLITSVKEVVDERETTFEQLGIPLTSRPNISAVFCNEPSSNIHTIVDLVRSLIFESNEPWLLEHYQPLLKNTEDHDMLQGLIEEVKQFKNTRKDICESCEELKVRNSNKDIEITRLSTECTKLYNNTSKIISECNQKIVQLMGENDFMRTANKAVSESEQLMIRGDVTEPVVIQGPIESKKINLNIIGLEKVINITGNLSEDINRLITLSYKQNIKVRKLERAIKDIEESSIAKYPNMIIREINRKNQGVFDKTVAWLKHSCNIINLIPVSIEHIINPYILKM